MNLASLNSIQTAPDSPALPLGQRLASHADSADSSVARAEEVREVFDDFMGEAFFGMMLKAMRSTTGEPAYFHGGRAEEIFQGQLDQTLAEEMTAASADRFSEPMFRQQFPHLADVLDRTESDEFKPTNRDELAQLSRR